MSWASLFADVRSLVWLSTVWCVGLCIPACQLDTPVQDGSGGSGTGSGGRGSECQGLDEAACAAAYCQEYVGYRIPEGAQCYEESSRRFFGCHYELCTPEGERATDADGQMWYFLNGCVPRDSYWVREQNYWREGPCGLGGAGGSP